MLCVCDVCVCVCKGILAVIVHMYTQSKTPSISMKSVTLVLGAR